MRGYVSLPTGSGKTVIFAEVIKHLQLPTLVLVPTTQLVDQTLVELRNRMPEKRIEKQEGWRRDDGSIEVTVATYASIAHKVDSEHFSINPSRIRLVVMDEAHKSMGTMSRRYIDKHLNHTMHLGFTASEDYSPKRKLQNHLFDEVYKLTIREAVDLEMIAPYRVATFNTHGDMSEVDILHGDYNPRMLDKALNELDRNQRIARFFAENLGGEKAIFNVNTIEHAEKLAEELRQNQIIAVAVHGSLPKDKINAILDAFKRGEIMALTQAQLLVEGFDDQGISVAFNVTPTLSRVRSKQRNGRALRRDPDRPNKVSLIVECVDDGYISSPLFFSDDAVSGWSGLDPVAPLERSVAQYRNQVPVYTDPQTIITKSPKRSTNSRIAKPSGDSLRTTSDVPKKLTPKQAEKVGKAFGRLRARREEVEIDGDLRDSLDEAEHEVQIIEKLCDTNPVLRHIVLGTDLISPECTKRNLQEALIELAGNEMLKNTTLERYLIVQQIYADVLTLTKDDHRESTGTEPNFVSALLNSFSDKRPEYQHSGACNGVDPNLFFPERGASTKEAKAVCRDCVVREDCLDYAIVKGEKFGIWGGLSERERRPIRKQRKLAAKKNK